MERRKLLCKGLVLGTAVMLSGIGLMITFYFLMNILAFMISMSCEQWYHPHHFSGLFYAMVFGGIFTLFGIFSCLTGWFLNSTNKVLYYILFVLGGFWLSLACVMMVCVLVVVAIEAWHETPRKSVTPYPPNEDLKVIQDEWERFWMLYQEPGTETEADKLEVGEKNENGDSGSETPEQELPEYWERDWVNPQPTEQTPYRTHGGVI